MSIEVETAICERFSEIHLLRRLYGFSEQEAIDFIEFCERGEVSGG